MYNLHFKVNEDGSIERPPVDGKLPSGEIVCNLPLNEDACTEMGYPPFALPDGFRFVARSGYNTIISQTDWEAETTVSGVTLDQTQISLAVGETATLTATISPTTASNQAVTWVSDNESVATVADGVVTAIAEGTANITATTADGGFTASCAVSVSASDPVEA